MCVNIYNLIYVAFVGITQWIVCKSADMNNIKINTHISSYELSVIFQKVETIDIRILIKSQV